MTTDVTDITVIIPVRDRSHFLEQCLLGVIDQRTALTVQTLVVDDGSTDDSASVAERLGAEVLRIPSSIGVGPARTRGLQLARGDWVAFLDSDDWWSPDHLDTLWKARRGVVMVASSAVTVSQDGVRVHGPPGARRAELRRPRDLLRPENIIMVSACMARRDALLAIGGFRPVPHCEDLDTWVRLLALGPGLVLPRLTVAYRLHEGQLSRAATPDATIHSVISAIADHTELPERNRRALLTAAKWDSRAGLGPKWVASQVASGQIQLTGLAWLLASRAWGRHRWRLQARRTRALRDAPGSRPPPC
ncbi:MAG: glycosyltransferase family 2 protein [Acidimicrobiales bacterium]